jgi:hypothetical protein
MSSFEAGVRSREGTTGAPQTSPHLLDGHAIIGRKSLLGLLAQGESSGEVQLAELLVGAETGHEQALVPNAQLAHASDIPCRRRRPTSKYDKAASADEWLDSCSPAGRC